MKLSKLYSNQPSLFNAITFTSEINVIYGEIRVPENKDKDTHNLGKSILGRVLDFTLLSKRHPQTFLFKHIDIFEIFVFYLEIELGESNYLTVKRDVSRPTKISFKKHTTPKEDYSALSDSEWSHLDVPFDRAKNLLDSLLNLSTIKPWHYRNAIGYLLRSQDDYSDVFQLKKFRSKDADWKPYLAHILGFNASYIKKHYEKEKLIKEKEEIEKTLENELGGSSGDINSITGILHIKQDDYNKKQDLLDAFDFGQQDKEKTELLVNDIDKKISNLNKRRYYLNKNKRKIITALEEDKILFNPEDAEKLFNESGVLFPNQIKKDFNQLISFNKAITEERHQYLLGDKREIDLEIKEINKTLNTLSKERSQTLSFLSDTEVFTKYKALTNELVDLKADIETLERQRQHLDKLKKLRSTIRTLSNESKVLQQKIEENVEEQNGNKQSLFAQIRLYFSEIIDTVINQKALLSVSPNKEGHLQFRAEILNDSGNATSADDGHTYKKLLCIAFDLAVLRAYSLKAFPHFAFHDGVFESLDNRKKENLLLVLKEYTNLGIQSVITLIDSDLPKRESDSQPIFSESEIILKLHDAGDQGRLFKLKPW